MPALRNSSEKTHVVIAEPRKAPIVFTVSLYYNFTINVRYRDVCIIIIKENIKMLNIINILY